MNKHILVTGAAGFIGSHLCEKLIQEGFRVTGIDNFDPFYARELKESNLSKLVTSAQFSFIEGDAGDQIILNSVAGFPDAVIHLAAKAGVQPSLNAPADYINGNILLTNNILEWMKEKKVSKFIFASSSSVYGNALQMPFEEDQDVNHPVSPYAFSKRCCELMNYTYHQLYKIDVINLRFFTVYGERQRPDLAIHKFVKKISNHEAIHMYGTGETSRDYTYWKDTVNGISGALNYIFSHNNVFETINLGNHQPVKLSELVSTISKIMAVDPKIIYEQKKAGDVDITYASIKKAKRLLNYNPATSLSEGLENFVGWFNHNTSS